MNRKLLIAIPCYETMRVEFAESLMQLLSVLNREKVWYEVKFLTGSLVYAARDHLAKHAVNNEFTHVLWIDSDMVFPGTIIDDLEISGERDMVCGLFISRHYPYVNCIFSSLDPVDRIDKVTETDAFRIAGCGFGCVLMKTEVLKAVMINNSGKCFIPEPKLGEDCAFCMRATAAGYEIWCEPTARVGHIGAVEIWPEDGKRLRGEIQGLEGKQLK